jgi:hypothetical protein
MTLDYTELNPECLNNISAAITGHRAEQTHARKDTHVVIAQSKATRLPMLYGSRKRGRHELVICRVETTFLEKQ